MNHWTGLIRGFVLNRIVYMFIRLRDVAMAGCIISLRIYGVREIRVRLKQLEKEAQSPIYNCIHRGVEDDVGR